MIQIEDPKNCCGCTACKSICPKSAIDMQPDSLGFLYPVVDEGKCINCGLCEKVCTFNDCYEKSSDLEKPLVLGVRHKNMNEVETSRSGAAFIAFSDWILNQGGCVYGAGFVEHFRVAHKRALTKKERNEFKGSKYVQSDLGNTFKQVKSDLMDGRYVLYSGTACQIAGLKSYIAPKLREKLFLVDIVCHGVPSPFIWRDYLKHIETKASAKAVFVEFRSKENGWSKGIEKFTFDKGNVLRSRDFSYFFSKGLMLRKSCFYCPFTNTQRPSDITIGDFWGWEQTESHINDDDKGLSLVFLNTLKGKAIFDNIKNEISFFESKIECCLQPNLCKPTKENPQRDHFQRKYEQKGFDYVFQHYKMNPLLEKVKRVLSKIKKSLRIGG